MPEYTVDYVKSIVEEARNANSAYVFKNMFPVTPTWDKFIYHLNDAIHNFPPSPANEPLKERIINGVIQRKLFYLMVDGPNPEYFSETLPIHDLFSKVFGGTLATTSAFINFVGKEESGGAHSDGNRDTLYWQCIGEARWQIHKNLDQKEDPIEYLLLPGDVIYVGPNVVHRVSADIPRAGIGFQYKNKTENPYTPNNLELGDPNVRS